VDKVQLRRQLKVQLSGLADRQRVDKSKKICRNLVGADLFKKSSVIMIYLSLPHEVDTTSIILHAWQQGKTVVVPKISWQQRHMIPVVITSLESGISADTRGLRNPITGAPIPLEDINLVITPGLGFDKNGGRLGRGGAFYDRFFESKALATTKCALAFSEQIVESVPMLESDKYVDILVTDEEIIKCIPLRVVNSRE